MPGSVDGPPSVTQVIPMDGAKDLMVTVPITAYFSEPVDVATLNSNSFKLYDTVKQITEYNKQPGTGEDKLPIDRFGQVPATIYTSLEGGRMTATLQPVIDLIYGRSYEIVLTQDIKDNADNDQCKTANPSPLCDGYRMKLDKAYHSTFTTKVPEAYSTTDFNAPNNGGYDIAIYTTPGGDKTYAYVTARDEGWRIIDVTDPTHPNKVLEQKNGSPNFPWRYYGVAVEPNTGIMAMTDWIGWLNEDETNYGYVRFYDVAAKPAAPDIIGFARVTEGGSGIPMKVAIMGNYAYISTIQVGLQIVDIELSKNYVSQNGAPAVWSSFADSGKSIAGAFDTINAACGTNTCGQPLDVIAYKSGYVLMTTMGGFVLIIDVNMPTFPTLVGYIKPGASAWRAGVVAGYGYTDSNGSMQTVDLAITSGMASGPLYVVDITDPANSKIIGTVKDMQGNIVTCQASDITISKQTRLAYVSAGNALYVIDIKDPKNPKNPILLNIIGNETYTVTNTDGSIGSSTVTIGTTRALVEQDGWVYLANQENGMKVLDLDPFTIKIVDIYGIAVKEIKYSRDGSTDDKAPDRDKVFMIKAVLDIPAATKEEAETPCSKIKGTISVQDEQKANITALQEVGYPANYNLSFKAETNAQCMAYIKVWADDITRFILSNVPKAKIENKENVIPIYGGIKPGNIFVKLEQTDNGASLAGSNNMKDKTVAKQNVQVILLGIDGLRQDVLYESPNYSDPDGCGKGKTCKISVDELQGMCNVLGGKYNTGICDPSLWDLSHLKLKNVTAIFPSITFASWASIFTGKQPKETGIMGNEFFARDLYASNKKISGLEGYPPGMVTLDADGGAFRPREGFLASPRFALKYAIPSEFLVSTYSGRLKLSAPTVALKAGIEPLWEEVANLTGTRYQINTNKDEGCENTKHECRTVSIFNQYPAITDGNGNIKGADQWGTGQLTAKKIWDYASSGFNDAMLLDSAATDRAVDFINNYYNSGKTKKFPAVFSVYLSGLDHDAHLSGMGNYLNFFKTSVDVRVADIVKALKGQNEFNNKIFIVVADHGHTAMPIFGKETLYAGTPREKNVEPGNSCELTVKGFKDEDVQDSEKANNSLHIWELANLFEVFPSPDQTKTYKILTPAEITKAVKKSATSDIEQANIIAALNGPMAHIYIKGADWKSNPDQKMMNLVVSLIHSTFRMGTIAGDIEKETMTEHFPRLINSAVDKILVRRTLAGQYEVIDGVVEDVNGNVTLIPSSLSSMDNADYADASFRIGNLNDKDRSGDIILIMKDKTTDTPENRFTSAYNCKSWHGSLNPSDSYVPLIVAYPGGNKYELSNIVDGTDYCSVAEGCDGNWNVTDLIKTIIQTQYGTQ